VRERRIHPFLVFHGIVDGDGQCGARAAAKVRAGFSCRVSCNSSEDSYTSIGRPDEAGVISLVPLLTVKSEVATQIAGRRETERPSPLVFCKR